MIRVEKERAGSDSTIIHHPRVFWLYVYADRVGSRVETRAAKRRGRPVLARHTDHSPAKRTWPGYGIKVDGEAPCYHTNLLSPSIFIPSFPSFPLPVSHSDVGLTTFSRIFF